MAEREYFVVEPPRTPNVFYVSAFTETLRKRVARAIAGFGDDEPWPIPEERLTGAEIEWWDGLLHQADAALAVVAADTEGIARVLLEHTRIGIWECACGGFHLYNGEPELRRKRHNEHLAAAVVAYLAGEGR